MPTSIGQGSSGRQAASPDAFPHDEAQPSTGTIEPSITPRSEPAGQSSEHALVDREAPIQNAARGNPAGLTIFPETEGQPTRSASTSSGNSIDQSSANDRPAASARAGSHDDDAQWIAIVLASLNSRSSEAREALLKALVHDEDAVTGVGPLSTTNLHPPPTAPARTEPWTDRVSSGR